MKKKIPLFLLASLFVLAGCDNTSSSEPTTDIPVPLTLKEIEENVSSTKFNGYTFSDKNNKILSATVSLYKNEVAVIGTASFEEEGESSFVQYRGFANNKYYDVESYNGKHARIKDIVEGEVDYYERNYKITKADAESDFASILYNKDWFVGDVMSFFEEGRNTTFVASDNNTKVNLSAYGGGTKTMSASLTFDSESQLLGGKVETIDWGKDNFDEETKTPYDKDQKPVSTTTKEASLLLGEITGSDEKISFDVSPYFVSSIDDFVVKGYSYGIEDYKAYVGDSLSISDIKFSPSTALNSGDIKIISSSNEEVVKCDNESLNTYKAIASGYSVITAGIPYTDIYLNKGIDVVVPPLKTIWISSKNSKIQTGDTFVINVELYPETAISSLDASNFSVDISGDTSALKSNGLSADLKQISFTALAATTKDNPAVIKLVYKGGEINSNSLKINVTEPVVEADKTWLVGKWKATNTITNDYDESITFETIFEFKADNSGSVTQTVTRVPVDNEASFTYTYDGEKIVFDSWSLDEEMTIKKPTSIAISSDKSTINMTANCMDFEMDYYTIKMELKKEVDISWLVGKWNADEFDEYDSATITFNLDFTGEAQFTTYGDPIMFTYTYDGTNLNIVLTGDTYSFKSQKSLSKTKIVLVFNEAEEGQFTCNFSK